MSRTLKILCIASGLLTTAATATWAAPGVDLAWNQCRGKAGAVTSRTSACTSTAGTQVLYASVNPPSGINELEGEEIYIDYMEQGGSLSCWWNFSSGTPRAGALTALFLPNPDGNGDATVLCGSCTAAPCTPNPNDGYYFLAHGASGGGGGIVTGPDTGQLKGIVAIQAGTGVAVPADVQQYACGFRITNALTGAGCAGCNNGVTLVLARVTLTQPGVPNVDVTNANVGNSVTWNGGTPTRKATWGAVKALYRN
jgi:hypothetical protein